HPRNSFLGSAEYWRRQLHPEDRERVLRAFREAGAERAEYVEEEFRFEDPDGGFRWYRGMAYPVTTDREQVSHFYGYVGDITARKQVEERLREERRRLREAQAMAGVGNWEWYPDEGRVYWSEEEFRIFGYEPGEVEAGYRAFRRRVHPEDRDEIDRLKQRVLEAGTGFETEFRLVHPDGDVRWVRERARVEPATEDRSRRMVGVTQDVTGQVEARRAAERAEEKWSTVVDLAPTGIAISEVKTGRFLVINEAAADLLGYTPDEATERSALEMDAGVSPDRRAELVREVRERQGVRNKTIELQSRSGETRHVRWSARLLEWEGREYLFQTVQDVTEEQRRREAVRRSERRYRSLVEDSPDPIVITTTDGEFVRVNDAFLEVTGYSRDELERLEAKDLYGDPERREELLEQLNEAGRVTDFEVELETRAGERRIVEFTSTVEPAPGGERQLVRAIGRDVTEERMQRKQLRRSEARYRTLFELSNDAIFVFDPDGRIREVNEKAAELTGRDASELEGTSLLDLHPEEGRTEAESALERTLEEGGGRFDLRFRRK
ncbi:MAG: PAS domain S-box protein, partial [Gemmatimonadota bacterium]